MKKMTLKALALVLVMCLAIPFVACNLQVPEETVEGYSYVTIDVNPTVELVVDGETVVGVNAVNDDAMILLSGETIEGLDIEKATEKIVSLCEELGYLNDENKDVKLTVTADSEEVTKAIEEFVEKGAKKGSIKAILNKVPRNADQRVVEELKEENPELYKDMTPAKVRLIESIMKFDGEMTYEIGVEMSVSELTELLKTYLKENKQAISSEIKAQMEARYEELKKEAKRRVAEMYGEDYLGKWDKHHELENIYKELEEKAENIELTEEDVQEILTILGIENAEEVFKNGEFTVEELEKYIDKKLHSEEFEEIKNQLNAIIDNYDEEDYVLSEEDKERIKEILGDVELDKLGDLEIHVEVNEEALEEFKENLDISSIEQAVIDAMEKTFDSIKEQIENEFDNAIKNSHNHFEQQKEEKRNHK